MFNHFEILPFLLGFFIGVLGILFWKEKPRIIVKYPHPSTVKNVVYRDANGMCYTYSSKEVNCDANEGTLKPYPLQDGAPVSLL
jgi:hypothetical protein